jgi:hypothetical protein
MGLKVLRIGAYPLEPAVVSGGVESATSTLVPALAERDDIDRVIALRIHHGDASTDYRREGTKVEVYYLRGQDPLCRITRSFPDVRNARKLVAELQPDMVHDGETGFVVESGDVATLADRLVALLNDQDLCLRMGRRGDEVARSRFLPEPVAGLAAEADRTALS